MDHKETCEKVLARRNFEGAPPPALVTMCVHPNARGRPPARVKLASCKRYTKNPDWGKYTADQTDSEKPRLEQRTY